MSKQFSFLLLLLASVSLSAQKFFKNTLKENDPIKGLTTISIDSAIAIHQSFLMDAESSNDTLKQLFGWFYLYKDYYEKDDYPALENAFLKASNLVNENSNPSWKAAIAMRKALLLELFKSDTKGALEEYNGAYENCVLAKDSFCMAECLEQMGNLNKSLGNFEQAHKWYNKAIEPMNKFVGEAEKALFYNNFGLLFSEEAKYDSAEIYIKTAIDIAQKNGNLYKEMLYTSNLASLYSKEKNYKKAIAIYLKCIPINTQNKWADRLLYNYTGIADAYEAIGELEETNAYTHKYYLLNDSIKGAEVKLQIAKLEIENETNKKSILYEKNLVELEHLGNKARTFSWLALVLLVIGSFVAFSYFKNKQLLKLQKSQHIEYVKNLGEVIAEKNALILKQNNKIKSLQIADSQSPNSDISEFQSYDFTLASEKDIANFKTYFQKAYPELLFNLRNSWSTITEAEERLLMLIKIKVSSKEAADILGISLDSVKKLRYRLRKRLELESDEDLFSFIDGI